MKWISTRQIAALWLCSAYSGITLAIISARAAWGFLRLSSEHPSPTVPRELLVSVAEAAARDFWLHAGLVAGGCIALVVTVAWITFTPARGRANSF